MRLALFQPDIPQNLGGAIRLAACMGVALDIIEPCGFPLSDKALARAAMDYREIAVIRRHGSWAAFQSAQFGRLILFTTSGAQPFHHFSFQPDDTLLFGRESAGAPDEVHAAADTRLYIPLRPPARSLNVVVSAAMALGEALRQVSGFPLPASAGV